ncbi:MAG TPA: radical SAM protein [Candidatus Omnitrophota bacterium]|nr:radical SAM protein [Candidatus Omnitrophota bacterium]HPT07376.1 radical SAM protein [Candidatus Omnitrophota bacterium]
MKITFIDPPNVLGKQNFERVFGCTFSLYPIPNIFSLSNAAVLEQDNFSVAYLDMANEKMRTADCKAFFARDTSDVYCMYSINLSRDSDLVVRSLIRTMRPGIPVIFLGPAPTLAPQDFIGDDTIVVRGESEYSLRELLRCLRDARPFTDVQGISYKEGEGIRETPPRVFIENLDEIPFPARHLLKTPLYYNPKLALAPFTAIQTSRNCSHRCSFCVPNSFNFARELEYRRFHEGVKPPVRMRSAKNVIEEFMLLQAQGYKAVSIIDDQFLWDESRSREICAGIQKTGIRWGCLARADRISQTIAAAMQEAGCVYIDLGVESFNQDVLNDIRKDLDVQKVYTAIDILKKNHILVKINLILGVSPIQTKEIIREDIRIAQRLDVDAVMFSLATPFPGTDFYKRAQENNWFSQGAYQPQSVQNRSIISYPGLSDKDLDALVRHANAAFYFSPRFIFKNIPRLLNPCNFFRALVALRRKFI